MRSIFKQIIKGKMQKGLLLIADCLLLRTEFANA